MKTSLFIQGDSLSAWLGPELIMVLSQWWILRTPFRSHMQGLLSVCKLTDMGK